MSAQPPPVPDDGQVHGPEIDAAVEIAENTLPHELGICETALRTRTEAVVERQLKEGVDSEVKEEIKATLLKAGLPFDDETVQVFQIRSTIGGTWSHGVSTGIALEQARAAKERES